MLQDQIKAMEAKEQEIQGKIDILEEDIKKVKSELTIIRRAKKSLERLEEQLNGQNDVSTERVDESTSY